MLKINIYSLIDSYQVDVWDGMNVIESFNVLCRSDGSVQQVRDFIGQYDMYKLKDELGIIDKGGKW